MFERCLYFNVNALARAVNRIWDQAFKELGLSPAHAYLLRLVLAEASGVTQKRLADELRLEKSTITRFVDALQDKGLVRRSRSGEGGGREQGVVATARARRIHAELERKGEALYRQVRAKLGDEEMKTLVEGVRKAAGTLA